MVDELPLDASGPAPRLPTLSLLIGRVTTIKLSYWAVLTFSEAALRFVEPEAPFGVRFRHSLALAVTATVLAVLWARWSARVPDRLAGPLTRSVPTVLTTFAVSAVVASPAGLPLLLLERQRSLEGCAAGITCHLEALVLWAVLFAAGTFLVPLAFALSLPAAPRATVGPR